MDTPTSAYSLLETHERNIVDDYVQYAINEQHRKRERVIEALSLPIPVEYLRRSHNMLHKPILRIAIGERLKEISREQDISPDRVIAEHALIAFSNITDYVEPSLFGSSFKLKDFAAEKWGAVKTIEIKTGMHGVSTKIVLHDKYQSLKAMGEMMGLVAPDKEPVLLEYVKPPAALEKKASEVSEKSYMELLESINA